MIKVFRDIFTEETHNDIYDIMHNHLSWKMHNVSEDGDVQKFWYCDGASHDYITKAIADSLIPTFENEIGSFEYIRFHCNAQTYGQDGMPHSDYQDSGTFTFIYFPMLEWKMEWGGELFIYEEDEIIFSWWPKPNSAVLFDSYIKHVGTAPRSRCSESRYSLAISVKQME